MKVYFSELAENQLLLLAEYLLAEWGRKVYDNFFDRLEEKIVQISTHPSSCPKSEKANGVHKCVVTKQTTLFYRINQLENEIEVITIFDSRQNPQNLKI